MTDDKGPLGPRLKTIFCFGHQTDIRLFAARFGFGWRFPRTQYAVEGRPTLVPVGGFGTVMGHDRDTTGFIIMQPLSLMSRDMLTAFEVCRQRYHYLGEYYA